MKWISVNDKLPPVQVDVLVANADCCDIAWLAGGEWVTTEERLVAFEVTHWCEIECAKEVTA